MWILTKHAVTGKIASYPKNVLALFPDLIQVSEDEPCLDCFIQIDEPEEEEVLLEEPTPSPRKKASKK